MKPRLLYVVTHPMSARYLLNGQLAFMRQAGFEVAVASSPGPELDAVGEAEDVEVLPIAMSRELAPRSDLTALGGLVRVMRRWQPDVVNSGTPKAGLLGMLAARAVGVPVRIYTLHGLRLETVTGPKRLLLSVSERLASACAQHVLAVSQSLAERYIALGLAPADKVRVLGRGTANGVQFDRFAGPDPTAVSRLRGRLGLPPGVPVVGYVGRLTRDKGTGELVDAFDRLREVVPDVRLLLVGDLEDGDPPPANTVDRIRSDPAIYHAGFLPDPAPAYAVMDVLAFPSHREGFGNVVIEAGAAGLPVAGFRATGTVDSVVHGVTGTLVDMNDVAGLAEALRRYLETPGLRARHGRAAQARVRQHFRSEQVWEALLHVYDRGLYAVGRTRLAA